MDEIAVLRWAAGCPRPLLKLAGLDHDALISRLRSHGLGARFLARVESESPAWVSPRLLDGVHALVEEAERDLSLKTHFLNEVLGPASDVEYVVLKGLTAYALTGDRSTIRRSADVDVLARDPGRMLRSLSQRGYETRPPRGPHEAGNVRAGGVTADIHRHYPVFKYPSDLATVDSSPRMHPLVWRSEHSLAQSTIPFVEIAESATRGSTADTRNVLVPSPSMACLISCCHLFNSYHYSSVFPRLKLGELADVLLLRQHRYFSQAEFDRLTTRFGAADAVSLVDALATIHLGPSNSDDLPLPHGHPQDLWWSSGQNGFLIDAAALSASDLLLQRADAAKLTELLDADVVPVTPHGSASCSTSDGRSLDRFLVSGSTRHQLSVGLRLSWDVSSIGLEVETRPVPSDRELVVMCNAGYLIFEHVTNVFGRSSLEGQSEGGSDLPPLTVRSDRDDDSVTVTMELPIAARGVPDRRRLPMLIGARTRAAGSFGAEASTLIPLIIEAKA